MARLLKWAYLRYIALPLGCACSAGCGAPDAVCDSEVATSSVAVKLADAGALRPIDSIELVVLAVLDDRVEDGVFCSATRVSLGVALTAAHCVDEVPQSSLRLRSAAVQRAWAASDPSCEGDDESMTLVVTGVSLHPTLDLAIVRFEESRAAEVVTANIRPSRASVGEVKQIAGFGLTESFSRGQLRAIDALVEAVTADSIVVRGLGGGACVGDSGGPLLEEVDGELRLLGALSRGSASCLGRDEYVAVAAAQPWLTEQLAESPPEPYAVSSE